MYIKLQPSHVLDAAAAVSFVIYVCTQKTRYCILDDVMCTRAYIHLRPFLVCVCFCKFYNAGYDDPFVNAFALCVASSSYSTCSEISYFVLRAKNFKLKIILFQNIQICKDTIIL